jgi:cysteine desulfurase
MQSHIPLYLDHQATTPTDPRVMEAMAPFMGEDFGNPHSNDHILGWRASQAVDAAAVTIASVLGVEADEIVFTSGATEANNLAILGAARGSQSPSRRRILVSSIEHKCVLTAARALTKREGFIVEQIPVHSNGEIDLDQLERSLQDDVLLVSVMAVNNEIGSIQPLKQVSELTQKHGALLHSDFAQAGCGVDLTALASVVDMLSLSAHKMYGPKGIGAAYIRRDHQKAIEPIIYGGGQQNGLRSGTLPTALCVGFAKAAEISANENEKDAARISALRNLFVEKLGRLGIETHLNGPSPANRHPGNANIRFKDIGAKDLLGALQPQLAASTGSACSSGIPEPSHVLRALGMSGDEAESSVRFSLGRTTTEKHVHQAIAIIQAALNRLKADQLF